MINLDLFHVEAKDADEREATFVGQGLRVEVIPDPTYPFTRLRITRGPQVFEEQLLYSHLALGKLLTGYSFDSVLEIGTHWGIAERAFTFAGKSVASIDILNEHKADRHGDYCEADFGRKFDAIWCSHVLEHQRNIGRFCDKMFNDLNEGGVAAITVPSALSPTIMGHLNTFTAMHLVYHLICAGFDCSDASVRQYDWQLSCIVCKKPNGIPRIPFGSEWQGRPGAMGFVPDMLRFFPREVQTKFSEHGHIWGEIERINW